MEKNSITHAFFRILQIHERMKEVQNRFIPFRKQETNTFSKELHRAIHNNGEDKSHTGKETEKSKEEIENLIRKIALEEGVSPELVLAVVKAESNLNPNAISKKGAIGLMQIMPQTAKELQIDPYDIQQNIRGGIRYLKELARKYSTLEEVLAAYNAGPGSLEKYNGIPPYLETQTYIKRIKDLLKKLED